MNLKRLWDTDNKRAVWTWGPNGKPVQLWTNEDWSYLFVYANSKRWSIEAGSEVIGAERAWANWKQLTDEEVWYYDTNEPTDLYHWDQGFDVYYEFVNGGSILQSWTIEEWETPEYTGDTPTKSATAQYTYTFSGWKPAVWPITQKTSYKAQFDREVNLYWVQIQSNNTDYGTVDESLVDDLPYGTPLSTAENVLTIGSGESAVTVTATAAEGYHFSSWGTVPATLAEDTIVTATFEANA